MSLNESIMLLRAPLGIVLLTSLVLWTGCVGVAAELDAVDEKICGLRLGDYSKRYRHLWDEPEGREAGRDGALRERISAGVEVRGEEYPWFADLVVTSGGGKKYCGATIIHKTIVMTAAECVVGLGITIDKVQVRAGFSNFPEGHRASQMRWGRKLILKESGDKQLEVYGTGDDEGGRIALVVLDRPLLYNRFIQPACLPLGYLEHGCAIVGFSKAGAQSAKLLALRMYTCPVDSRPDLLCFYPGLKERGRRGKTCPGDEGDPLLCSSRDGHGRIRAFATGVASSISPNCSQFGKSYFISVYQNINAVLRMGLEALNQ